MRLHSILLTFLASFSSILAEPSQLDSLKSAAESAAREEALDNLLSERESPEAMDKVIAAARKTGISEQAILEARFLYHVDRRENEAIAKMLPDFLKQREAFKLEDSAIFGVKEDWLAVLEYVQAIDALGKDDRAAFKNHITEAFWLSPRQAAAFAPHIERMRLEESMRSVKLDFNLSLLPLASDSPVTLAKLIAGKNALLLHFWSPLSRECEAAMPDFAATAALLSNNGIAVVSLLPNKSPEILTPARTMIEPIAKSSTGAWLIDSEATPLARDLRILNLPTMVLVSNQGTILFNGDPTDHEFWETLNKIDSRITRPKSALEKAE